MKTTITFTIDGGTQDLKIEGADALSENFEEVKARLNAALDGFKDTWDNGIDDDDDLGHVKIIDDTPNN